MLPAIGDERDPMQMALQREGKVWGIGADRSRAFPSQGTFCLVSARAEDFCTQDPCRQDLAHVASVRKGLVHTALVHAGPAHTGAVYIASSHIGPVHATSVCAGERSSLL